jgi:hypothetical protein
MPAAKRVVRKLAKPRPTAGRLVLPGTENPELPSRKSMHHITLFLKNEPVILDAIERLVHEAGYHTVHEAIRHLLFVGISATPTDGEFRAAMSSVRSQMQRYVTVRFWHLLNEMMSLYEKDWRSIDGHAFVEREIARFQGELPPKCAACGHDEGVPA